MGRTANIIIKDIIHIFASISKIMRILLMGRRNRERCHVRAKCLNDKCNLDHKKKDEDSNPKPDQVTYIYNQTKLHIYIYFGITLNTICRLSYC